MSARRPLSAILFALALAGCDGARPANQDSAAGAPASTTMSRPEAAAVDTPPRLTPDGWGELRIGMTRAEVVAAAGDDANPNAVGGPDPDSCDEFRPARAPDGLLVMMERGRLTRISLGSRATTVTDRGFAVGASGSAVASAYGNSAVSSLHKYMPTPASYITAWKSAARDSAARGIVYEVNPEGRVTRIHAGGPSIAYVEGCL